MNPPSGPWALPISGIEGKKVLMEPREPVTQGNAESRVVDVQADGLPPRSKTTPSLVA